MRLLGLFKKSARETPLRKRMFSALSAPSLSDAKPMPIDTNEGIRASLGRLRSLSRSASLNDGYAKKYFATLETNLVGENGLRPRANFKSEDGLSLARTNKLIEREFERWSKRGVCEVTGRHSWRGLQRLIVTHLARDGEALLRFIKDPARPYGFVVQLIDPIFLDENYNRGAQKGQNKVMMGVELDAWNAPVAYHISAKNEATGEARVRVPASEMLHIFMPYFANQVRGVPWLHASLIRLHNLGKYEEAELIAARVEASKMGFLTPDPQDESLESDVDDDGNIAFEVTPGSLAVLRPGMKFESWNPQHPNGNAAEFVKNSLLGVASGLNVAYASLSSDLSKVNFSSVRHGEIKDRDRFKLDQVWLQENLCEPVYQQWLYAAMLAGRLTISPLEIESYYYPEWIAKRWDWVDPLKDVSAAQEAIKTGLKSRTQVVAEMGREIEDVMREIAAEEALAKTLGIKVSAEKETPKQEMTADKTNIQTETNSGEMAHGADRED